MSSHSMEEGQQDNLQLHVQNTFFHVKDASFEAQKSALRRSSSDSSLGFESLVSSEGPSSLGAKPVILTKISDPKVPPTTDNCDRARRFFPADKDRSGPLLKDPSGSSCPSHLVWSTSESSWSNLDGSSSSHSGVMPQSVLPRPVTISRVANVGAGETPQMEANSHMFGNGSALPDQSVPHVPIPNAGYSAATAPPQQGLQQGPAGEQGQSKEECEDASLQDEKHANGTCSPCVFWFKAQCTKANKCLYCHLPHTGQKNKRVRPSKKTREARRAAVELHPHEDPTSAGEDAAEEPQRNVVEL